MLTRHRFSDLSESLISGFFADNAVLTLAKAKKNMKLTPDDTNTLNKISEFLADALKGFDWSENPKLSSHSEMSALAFSKAVHAVRVTITHDSGDFKKKIKEYLKVTERLLNHKPAAKDSLQSEIDFFTTIGRSQLEKADNIIHISTPFGSRKMISR